MKNMQKVTAVWSCTSYLLLLDTEGLLIWSSRCAQSIRLEIWVRSSTTNEGNRRAGQTKSWIEKWGSKMCVPKWVKKVIFCTLVRSRFQKFFILTKKFRVWNFWSGSSSLLTFPIAFPRSRQIHFQKTRQVWQKLSRPDFFWKNEVQMKCFRKHMSQKYEKSYGRLKFSMFHHRFECFGLPKWSSRCVESIKLAIWDRSMSRKCFFLGN